MNPSIGKRAKCPLYPLLPGLLGLFGHSHGGIGNSVKEAGTGCGSDACHSPLLTPHCSKVSQEERASWILHAAPSTCSPWSLSLLEFLTPPPVCLVRSWRGAALHRLGCVYTSQGGGACSAACRSGEGPEKLSLETNLASIKQLFLTFV